MKTIFIKICFSIFSLFFVLPIQAQSLSALWKRVENAVEKDNPQEVIALTGDMFQIARQQKKVPEMMRAYLTRMEWRNNVSPDSLEVDRKGLLEWAEGCEDAVDKSVLYFLYGLSSGKEGEAYVKKALALEPADAALQELLASTSALAYEPVVEPGTASKVFNHDLLSLFRMTLETNSWRFGSTCAWMKDVFERDRAFYRSKQNMQAALAVALEWDDCRYSFPLPVSRRAFLNALIKENAPLPLCAEVERRLADEEPLPEGVARLRRAIAAYPKYERVDELKADLEGKTCPSARFEAPADVYPGKSLQVHYWAFNVKSFQVSWRKVNDSFYLERDFQRSSYQDDKFRARVLKNSQEIGEKQIVNVSGKYLAQVDSAFVLQVPAAPGSYLLEISPKECFDYAASGPKPTYLQVLVSKWMVVSIPVTDKKSELQVLDSWTGKPVAGAVLRAYELGRKDTRYHELAAYKTDEHGTVLWENTKREGRYWAVEKEGDKGRISYFSTSRFIEVKKEKEAQLNLYTDRAIYRPGQEVKYSVLAWEQLDKQIHVIPNETVVVNLVQARQLRENVLSDTLKTDAFGVAEGSFLLPVDSPSGEYLIKSGRGFSARFRVEEYKRPTFDVNWEPVTVSYALGDTLLLKGKALAYSGAPIQGARVILTATCRQQGWWRKGTSMQIVQQQETVTGLEGDVEFRMPLYIPQEMKNQDEARFPTWYAFEVEMTVTSQDGETHVGKTSLVVAESPYLLDAEVESRVEKSQITPWKVRLTNLEGVDLNREVEARLYAIGKEKEISWSGKLKSGSTFTPDFLTRLPSGKYRLEVKADTLKVEKELLLFSLADKTPVEETSLWAYAPSGEFDPQHEAVLQLGTSRKHATLQYHIYTAQGRVEKGAFQLSNSLELLSLPYKESYGDGIEVVLLLVHEGKVETLSRSFRRTKPDRKLKAEWISVRDYSLPGAQENWTLRLTLPDGTPAAANLMAVLYDASLDGIASHAWTLSLGGGEYWTKPSISWPNVREWGNLNFPLSGKYKYKERVFDRFVSPLASIGPVRVGFPYRKMKTMALSRATGAVNMEDNVAMPEMMAAKAESESASMDTKKEEEQPVLRKEFQETAFFYPELRTDKEGVVTLQFKLPQSITEWHLMGLAHTREMNFTTEIDHRLKVSRPFMVKPNLPRFMRKGDKVKLPVTLRNTGEAELRGELYLTLKDSTLVAPLLEKNMPFCVQAGGTETLFFSFDVPDYVGGTLCEVLAQAGEFSDGEQHELPILSDEVWVEESRAYYLNAPKQTVNLSEMLNGGKLWNPSTRMTVKVVQNPVGEIISQLKTHRQQVSTCNVVDLALGYYASSLSLSIPALHESADSLVAVKYLEQVEKMQKENGGFGWYSGMDSSPYITRLVAEAFIRLTSLGVQVPDKERLEGVVKRAVQYLDEEMVAYYERMKKGSTHWGVTDNMIHYLYLNTLYPHPLSKAGKEASAYFVSQLQKNQKDLSIYQKAMFAIVLQAQGKQKAAMEAMRSMVGYSVYSEELGRYYDTYKAEYSWRNYRIPTQTMAVEALAKITPEETQLLSDYVRWLMNQKRTQLWENSANTLDALYAILNLHGGQVEVDSSESEKQEHSYTANEYKHMPAEWVLEKKEASPVAWAEVSMKTLAKLEEVQQETPHTGLRLNVEYRREVLKGKEKTYVPVNRNDWKVGDKVRAFIQVKADRDMDFVEMILPRAACLEPVSQLSGYQWGRGLSYYQVIKDREHHFCIDRMPKGQYELTADFYVTLKGAYRTGIPTVQCTYAPEFQTHGESVTLQVR